MKPSHLYLSLGVNLLGLVSATSFEDDETIEAHGDFSVIDSGEPAKQPADFFTGPTLQVIWEKHVSSGKSAVAVWGSDSSTLYSYSCGDSTPEGGLPFVVAIDADETADGTIKVGSKSYKIEFEPTVSGGVSCIGLYNDDVASAECTVPLEQADAETIGGLVGLSGNSTAECFGGVLDEEELMSVNFAPEVEEPAVLEQRDISGDMTMLEPRQDFPPPPGCGGGTWQYDTHCYSIGITDRSKYRKWRRHEQISVPINCGSLRC